MDINGIIIKTLETVNIKYIQNYNIEYRCSSIDVDFYLPESRMFIFLEREPFMHEVYKDIRDLGSFNGYRTTIIPLHEITTEKELVNYINKAMFPDYNQT